MEKLVSSSVKRMIRRLPITCFAIFAYFINTLSLSGQTLPTTSGEEYIIGDIIVTGINSYNENTVITFTGLKTGDRITLPGERISKVIKKLWDLELFSDINFYITSVEGDVANLELNIQEVAELENVRIVGNGMRKAKVKEFIKDNGLTKGTKVTENLLTTTRNFITNTYKEKGFLNTKVVINTTAVLDTVKTNKVNMVIRVDKGPKVKIDNITINGNTQFKDAKVLGAMKKTKSKKFWRFWKRSKYIKDVYLEDKDNIISKYKEKGFRDARITKDTLIVDGDDVSLDITLEEGNKHYFGTITFLGNSVYSDQQLAQKLVLKKGDVYNGVLLEKQIADNTKPDANDITNLYQNTGYLFSNINAVETKIENDTIDFEIRILEGKLVHFDHITISGNNRTNDHVVYRNIRTLPGNRYSKELVVRTIREIGQLGFFDPEQLNPEFKNPNPNEGTVDINYAVVEKGASQIELQGGIGGRGFIGTLGLAFNNFSMRNIFNGKSYSPLPMGDGQTLRIRAQASQAFQTYSISFIEPWLGGKKPFQLSTSFSHSIQYAQGNRTADIDKSRRFLVTGGSIGIAKRLNWPDNYFTLSQSVSMQHINLKNFNRGLFTFGDGYSNNLSYTIGLNRNNTAINPIFPISGSEFNAVAKLTLPYSLFNGVDYGELADQRASIIEERNNLFTTNPLNQSKRTAEINEEISTIDQERFKWLEYYKIKFNAAWYTSLTKGKKPLVLRTKAEYGFLGAYNTDRGNIPFERFQMGGNGLGGGNFASTEIVGLRGYDDRSIVPESRTNTVNPDNSENDGAIIYNKYSLELRYPITLKPQTSIYVLGFVEGGAVYDNFNNFNPFQLKRSAGVGVRLFMPAFGLLGVDWGYGFDPVPGSGNKANGTEFNFVIGREF